MSKIIRFAALLMAIGAFLLTLTPSFAQTSTKGSIRLINASPDAPALDFYFNQTKTYTGLKFKDVSNYWETANGTYDVKAYPSSANGTGTPLFEIPNFTVGDGSVNTLVAVGLVKNNSESLLPLNDAGSATVSGSNQASIRFIHGSPDAPAVNVSVNGVGDVFSNVSFKSVDAYMQVPSGNLQVTVKPASDPGQVVLTKSLNVVAGKAYSVFVVGEVSNNALDTVVTTDNVINSMPSTGEGFNAQGLPGFMNSKLGLVAILLSIMGVSGFFLIRPYLFSKRTR